MMIAGDLQHTMRFIYSRCSRYVYLNPCFIQDKGSSLDARWKSAHAHLPLSCLDKMIMKLTAEQTEALPFPIGCEFYTNHRSALCIIAERSDALPLPHWPMTMTIYFDCRTKRLPFLYSNQYIIFVATHRSSLVQFSPISAY